MAMFRYFQMGMLPAPLSLVLQPEAFILGRWCENQLIDV